MYRMSVGLGFGAPIKEYRFVLQSDVSKDQVVVVRANNLSDLTQKQSRVLDSIATELNAKLQHPATIKRLKEGSKVEAEAELTETVRNALARENRELPESAQWLFAASFLNASNWPTLAAGALRRAEAASPATAKSSSARWLAGAIAAQSGVERVFATAETPKLRPEEVPKPQLVWRMTERGQAEPYSQMAIRLQQIPSLKPYGFSLEGDLQLAKGNRQAAYDAYNAAASIDGSPSLYRRMSEIEGTRRAPVPPSELKGKPGASTTTPPRTVEPSLERGDRRLTEIPSRSGDARAIERKADAVPSSR